jgi:hypothetical protein
MYGGSAKISSHFQLIYPPAYMNQDKQKRLNEIAQRKAQASKKRFLWECNYFSLDPELVERTITLEPPARWASIFGGGQKGGRAASSFALSLAKIHCLQGNHQEEERLGLAAVHDVVTDEAISYRDAWLVTLTAIQHQLESSTLSDNHLLAQHLYELSLEAIHDLDIRLAQPGHALPSEQRQLDSVVNFLLKAEQILGISRSSLTADLERRERNTKIRKRMGSAQPFSNKHRVGIIKLWHEQRESWFKKRYESKTGQPAPADFMVKSLHASSGYQMRDEIRRIFTPQDHEDFRADMEALYRQQQGLPAKGEGWVSETHLAKCVEKVLSGHQVIREARPEWLAQQRLDVFVPDLKLAIEYQGEQHYFPLEHWGGEQGFKDRQAMDKTKREACRKAGITLIEWSYKTPITEEMVLAALRANGIETEIKSVYDPHR